MLMMILDMMVVVRVAIKSCHWQWVSRLLKEEWSLEADLIFRASSLFLIFYPNINNDVVQSQGAHSAGEIRVRASTIPWGRGNRDVGH